MRGCLGCFAFLILLAVVSYDGWLAVGWMLETFFDIEGTLFGIALQIVGAGIAMIVLLGVMALSFIRR